MSRVLLINANTCQAPYPVPPVGLCCIAESLSGRHEVRVFDGTFAGTTGTTEAIRGFDPEYIGIGIRNVDDLVSEPNTFFIDDALDRFVRPAVAWGRAPVILGGGAFSIFPGELLALSGADFGVIGEGESACGLLIDTIEKGGDPHAVPGVAVRTAGRVDLPPRPAAPSPMRYSAIERHIDIAPYRQRGAYPIQTKRGCEHRCIYCTYPFVEGNAYRCRTAADITAEIAAAAERTGPFTFEFVDSIFNDPPGFAEAICTDIAARGVAVRLRTMGLNPHGVNGALLDLMRKAGFVQIDCTPDSASPAMIDSLRKNFTRGQLERSAAAIRDSGMPTMWFFVFGGPGETAGTVMETFDFIDRFIAPDDLVYVGAGFRIFPHTGLYDRALADGVIRADRSLLRPAFYFSPAIGRDELRELLSRETAGRPNCVPSGETTPSAAMMTEALRMRTAQKLDGPRSRTLLRLRRLGMR